MMTPFAKTLLSAFLLCSLFLMQGCSTSGSKSGGAEDAVPVEELYNSAADALDAEEYEKAAKLFEEVERQHPYSVWATRAELMAAYAYYKRQKYDEATLALDRYLELHPGSEELDYALYLKAMCYYEQITDVSRDQEMTKEALQALEALTRRFPESRYARDARLKLDLTQDHLAGKEMEIGRYYLRRGYMNAAINRFRTVVKDFQTTTHVPEALYRLVEANLTLGLTDEATRVAAVLGYNYPGSDWYDQAYKLLDPKQRQRIVDDHNWLDRTVDSLFKPD